MLQLAIALITESSEGGDGGQLSQYLEEVWGLKTTCKHGKYGF